MPAVEAATGSALEDVSCSSSTSCMAAGTFFVNVPALGRALTEQFG